MNSPKTWHDLIPAKTMETDKEDSLLLQHIMDFHIHPADSFLDEPEPMASIPETSSQEEEDLLKLEELPRSKSWRRLSEGSIVQAIKTSQRLQPFRDIPQPLPMNRLWLQGPKMDHDSTLAHYPMRNPAWRVLNMERAFSRSRPRVSDHKTMQRLNVSPVRSESIRKHVSKIFIPSKTQCVRSTGQGNRDSGDEIKPHELSPASSQSSGYVDLSQIRVQPSDKSKNRDLQPTRDALVDNQHDISYLRASSEKSIRPMSVVTISADAELHKVICAPEVLCEPKRIAMKHLKNCLVTYIPESGTRFVTCVSDDISQADSHNKELGKKALLGEQPKSDNNSGFGVDDQPTNHNKVPEETKSEGSEVNSDDSNQTRPPPKFLSNKGTLNTRRGPLKSLTSRAIPIDSPDLKPVCIPAPPQNPNPKTKTKLFRRKESAPRRFSRQYSTSSSYAPSFPDSTIMNHIQRAGGAKGTLKFNRVLTHHQKSNVADPVKDFRKEVKRIMQTSQGIHLKPRMVQAPSGHPKIIACHLPNTPSTSLGAVRYAEHRNKGRHFEPLPRRVSRGKHYAVLMPSAHHFSGMESPPIYVMSSPSMYVRSFKNEMDA